MKRLLFVFGILVLASPAASSGLQAQLPCSACDEWYDWQQASWFHTMGLDGTWDWQCGAPGAQCHGGAAYDRCGDHHVNCIGFDLAALKNAATSGDQKRIANLLAVHAKNVRINASRASLQITDCNGRLIANIPIGRELTLALSSAKWSAGSRATVE